MTSIKEPNPQSGRGTVTIALPVFNGGKVLALAVESILAQTYQDWELLILDDGSTDGAVQKLHCLRDTRIKVVFDGTNKGLAHRLNQAIDLARGRYFARMDHDDICHPERFFRQVIFLERHPEVDLLATQCITIDEQERLNGTLPSAINHESICRRPWHGFYMPHPTWLGRIEWFRRNPYKEPASYCCEDQEVLLRAHMSSCYHTLPEHLLAYRVRSHTHWQKLLSTHAAMLRMQNAYFLSRAQWADAILSTFMALARIGRDGWRELRYRLLSSTKTHWGVMPPPEERYHWELLISALKAETSNSGNNEFQDAKT